MITTSGRGLALRPEFSVYIWFALGGEGPPYDDLGRAWRESVQKVISTVEQFEWLECLLAKKARQAEENAALDKTGDLDDEDDADVEPLHPEIDTVVLGTFRKRKPPAIQGGGYVVKSLEAAPVGLSRCAGFSRSCAAGGQSR